jgi:hypothetical protein
MMKLLRGWRKSFLIGLVALVISTLGIQASDEFLGITGRLTGAVIESQGVCGSNAEPILFGSHTICLDKYEASPALGCIYSVTENQLQTETNLAVGNCSAVSMPEAVPWRFVTYTQAQQLCARSGKRLPTNEEWYKVAIGLGDTTSCFSGSNSEPKLTGSAKCTTPTNIDDLVGNVWEWMDDVVTNGNYQERILPESGYVSLVDDNGVVIETSQNPEANFGKDYAWINKEGVRGILRGGFYGSGEDGGIFTQNISVALDFASAGVGFRCVKDLQ